MNFIVLGFTQFMAFLMATIDIRAIAQRRYWMAVLTNASIPMLNYSIYVMVKEHNYGLLGAIALGTGGALSAVLGIWLTRHWRDDHDSDTTGRGSLGASERGGQ